jgi:aryl-phospho-beta-D-glucosidase BglC (GH1 family)
MKGILAAFLTFVCLTVTGQGNQPSLIKVSGNRFVDVSGKTIVFRGVNFSDPDKLEKAGKWTKRHFEEAKTWGANIVRLPIHPSAWRNRGKENYLKLLDLGVQWTKELNLYLIIDWHSIGNLRTELYQHDMYNTTRKETFEFWLTISRKYAKEPVVAMYEIFNEPTTYNNQLGTCTWAQWKEMMIDYITVIKANNPDAIPLVGGFNWAYDLTEVRNNPVDIPGIAYVSHPYPEKRPAPWEPKWEQDWGFVADKYPVILTEVGFALPEEKGVHIPVNGDETYGKALVEYTAKKGISWVVWVFDPDWAPMMFSDWNYTPTRQGAFFRKEMQRK